MKPAVFLAKNTTLVDRSSEGGRLRLAPGAVDACLLLAGLGYELVVVGAEPAVARGALPPGVLEAVSAHLDDLFLTHGFRLAGSYWCPHDPEGSVADYAFACDCRRPAPGLIRAAARDHELDLSRSWAIGNDMDDIEAGLRAGCSTVWIGDPADDPVEHSLADLTARDLLDAAARIMRAREGRPGGRSYPVLDAY